MGLLDPPALTQPRADKRYDRMVHIDVRNHGAVGDGVTDDSTAIRAAAAEAISKSLPLFFPVGTWKYTGAGLAGFVFPRIKGASRFYTKIQLSAGGYFLDEPISGGTQNTWGGLVMEDITVSGGAGAFRLQFYNASSIPFTYTFNRCDFRSYTGCAVQSNSTDSAYWMFRDCVWVPTASSSTSIGIALNGFRDGSFLDGCVFQEGMVHLKVAQGAQNFYISKCSFLPGGESTTGRIKIWVVPTQSSVLGRGLAINQCKFGNELQNNGDYHLVFADDAGIGISGCTTSGSSVTVTCGSNPITAGVTTGMVVRPLGSTVADGITVTGTTSTTVTLSTAINLTSPTALTFLAALTGDRLPDLTHASAGYVGEVSIDDSTVFNGSGTAGSPYVNALIFSTTPNVQDCVLAGELGGTYPTYIVQFLSAPGSDTIGGNTVFGPFMGNSGGAFPATSNSTNARVLTNGGVSFPGQLIAAGGINAQTAYTLSAPGTNGTYNVGLSDDVVLMSGNNVTAKLPDATTTPHKTYTIVNFNAVTGAFPAVSVTSFGGVVGQSAVYPKAAAKFISDGANWQLVQLSGQGQGAMHTPSIRRFGFTTKTNQNYTLVYGSDDSVAFLCNDGNTYTATLPSAAIVAGSGTGFGVRLVIANRSDSTTPLTLASSGTSTVPTPFLLPGQTATLVSDGTNWLWGEGGPQPTQFKRTTVNVMRDTSPLADPTWSNGGSAVDSGPALAAAFTKACAQAVHDPMIPGSFTSRGRTKIQLPAGAYYTAQPLSLMSSGATQRTFGLKYEGEGLGLTQLVFQPTYGNPRTFTDPVLTADGFGQFNQLQSSTANFTSADVGRRTRLHQVGVSGGTLETIIVAVTDSQHCVLGVPGSVGTAGLTNLYAVITSEAVFAYNNDHWFGVEFEDLEIVARTPSSGTVPSVTVQDALVGRRGTDGQTFNGSGTVVSASVGFTQEDIGAYVEVDGAGAGGSTLTGWIITVNSPGSVSITTAAALSASGQTVRLYSKRVWLGRVVNDAQISNGSKLLNSATANFTTADIGVTIGVAGASSTSTLLRTSIQGIVSSTQAIVAQAATADATGAQLTLAGKAIDGKYIGNTATFTGAGPGGADLTAVVRAIQWRDVNTVPTCTVLIDTAPGTVTGSVTSATFTHVANAIFWRCYTSSVTGPIYTNVMFNGAWADVHLLDGPNQNADIYFNECQLYGRPGTFLHILTSPAPSAGDSDDQQLDFEIKGGIWAPTYGDFINFDGRGGMITCTPAGSMTMGSPGVAVTSDDGGTLPVALTGDVTGPGGTWFKLRSRNFAANDRTLLVQNARFEHRTEACLVRDIEAANGSFTFENCTDIAFLDPLNTSYLTTAVTSGTPTTSLAVLTLSGAAPAGFNLLIEDGKGNRQVVTPSGAGGVVGGTSIPVTSFTPTATFPVGSRVRPITGGSAVNVFTSRVGNPGAFTGVAAGPKIIDRNCDWKGRHLVRYVQQAQQTSGLVYRYKSCWLAEQPYAWQQFGGFLAYQSTDNSGFVYGPPVYFEDSCRSKTMTFAEYVDCVANWQWSRNGAVTSRKWLQFGGPPNSGLPIGTGGVFMTLPYYARIYRLHVLKPADTGYSGTDWSIVVKDGIGNVLHTFQPGSDGIPIGTTWAAGFEVTVDLAASWQVGVTSLNRTFEALDGPVGVTANTNAIIEMEVQGT